MHTHGRDVQNESSARQTHPYTQTQKCTHRAMFLYCHIHTVSYKSPPASHKCRKPTLGNGGDKETGTGNSRALPRISQSFLTPHTRHATHSSAKLFSSWNKEDLLEILDTSKLQTIINNAILSKRIKSKPKSTFRPALIKFSKCQVIVDWNCCKAIRI